MGASEKNNEQANGEKETVETNQFVDTLWNQYEQTLDRVRKLRESREDAYLNAVKEVIRFNQEFRGSLANLYQTTKETNEELVKGVTSGLGKKGEEKQVISPELSGQFEELANRLKDVAAAPLIAGLELIANLENNVEEASENFVSHAKENREGWHQVTDQYVKAARNSHQNLVKRVEESLKGLTKDK